ncbi:hypothetical protein M6B38_346115 [Iris pallida]|uniref:Uncharacterized protein n=1 Tax=Iris pallida TaxID=29817 RepID=A0AAX6GW47_IRIPA|nr:hypothetical protein M6B38_346115 [Iris pallida]
MVVAACAMPPPKEEDDGARLSTKAKDPISKLCVQENDARGTTSRAKPFIFCCKLIYSFYIS